MADRIFPIGIRAFSDIRNNGYAYVDKSAHVYRLTQGEELLSGAAPAFRQKPIDGASPLFLLHLILWLWQPHPQTYPS